MLQILFTEYRLLHRYAPVNAQGFVLDVDSAIGLRMIELIAFVLEDSGLRENSEAMGKAPRNKELTMIVFCQFYCYMLAECRRAFTDVNGYVEDAPLTQRTSLLCV